MNSQLSRSAKRCGPLRRNVVLAGSAAVIFGIFILKTEGAAYACRSRYAPPPRANVYGLPPHMRPCFSLDDCDRKAFDESGTRGRMGLGADPAHPEGPGNVSD